MSGNSDLDFDVEREYLFNDILAQEEEYELKEELKQYRVFKQAKIQINETKKIDRKEYGNNKYLEKLEHGF